MPHQPVQIPMSITAAQIWTGIANSPPTLLIYNPDSNNTVYVGKLPQISGNGLNVVPIPPMSSFTVDGADSWWGISTANDGKNLVIIPGGTNFFQPANRITAGQFIAQGVNSGVYVYNALNQLIASITPTAGTDPINGLPTKADITVYDPSGTDYVQIFPGVSGSSPAGINIGTGDTAEVTPAQILSGTLGSGATRRLAMVMSNPFVSGEPAGGNASLTLASPSADLSLVLFAQMEANDGASNTAGSICSPAQYQVITGNTPGQTGTLTITPATATLAQRSGYTGVLQVSQSDATSITVTFATFTAITKAWSIPANDANAATCYRLTCWGTGVQGSTAQTLSFELSAFGVSLAGSGYASTFAGVGVAFVFLLTAVIQVTTTGTGTARIQANWECDVKVAGAAVGQPLSGGATNTTATTTSAENIEVLAQWGATTGAPTLTCLGSMLERLGSL